METARSFALVAVEAGLVTPRQVLAALREQQLHAPRHRLLAEVLLDSGLITKEELVVVLNGARGYHEGLSSALNLGDVAVERGYVTPLELLEALKIQRDEDVAGEPHRLLGDILVQLGHLSVRQLVDILASLAGQELARESLASPGPLEVPPLVRAARSGSVRPHAAEPALVRARDVMRPAALLGLDARLGEARRAALELAQDGVLLVYHDRVVGTLDLRALGDVDSWTPAARCMERVVHSAAPHASVHQIAAVFRVSGLTLLPIVWSQEPLGFVRPEDLVQGRVAREHAGTTVPEWEELGVVD
jgi:hypothetical protein